MSILIFTTRKYLTFWYSNIKLSNMYFVLIKKKNVFVRCGNYTYHISLPPGPSKLYGALRHRNINSLIRCTCHYQIDELWLNRIILLANCVHGINKLHQDKLMFKPHSFGIIIIINSEIFYIQFNIKFNKCIFTRCNDDGDNDNNYQSATNIIVVIIAS